MFLRSENACRTYVASCFSQKKIAQISECSEDAWTCWLADQAAAPSPPGPPGAAKGRRPQPAALDFLKTKSHLLGVLSSPRINTNLGYAAGKIGNAYEMLPQASVEDLINAGLLVPRTGKQGEQ